jgi:hypothetical protein
LITARSDPIFAASSAGVDGSVVVANVKQALELTPRDIDRRRQPARRACARRIGTVSS